MAVQENAVMKETTTEALVLVGVARQDREHLDKGPNMERQVELRLNLGLGVELVI